MSELKFETDENGIVVTKPVMGWIIAPAAGIAVVLGIRYAETEEEIGTGGRQIQFVLMPQQCLELAEVLTKQAKHLLQPHTGTPPM